MLRILSVYICLFISVILSGCSIGSIAVGDNAIGVEPRTIQGSSITSDTRLFVGECIVLFEDELPKAPEFLETQFMEGMLGAVLPSLIDSSLDRLVAYLQELGKDKKFALEVIQNYEFTKESTRTCVQIVRGEFSNEQAIGQFDGYNSPLLNADEATRLRKDAGILLSCRARPAVRNAVASFHFRPVLDTRSDLPRVQ